MTKNILISKMFSNNEYSFKEEDLNVSKHCARQEKDGYDLHYSLFELTTNLP